MPYSKHALSYSTFLPYPWSPFSALHFPSRTIDKVLVDEVNEALNLAVPLVDVANARLKALDVLGAHGGQRALLDQDRLGVVHRVDVVKGRLGREGNDVEADGAGRGEEADVLKGGEDANGAAELGGIMTLRGSSEKAKAKSKQSNYNYKNNTIKTKIWLFCPYSNTIVSFFQSIVLNGSL